MNNSKKLAVALATVGMCFAASSQAITYDTLVKHKTTFIGVAYEDIKHDNLEDNSRNIELSIGHEYVDGDNVELYGLTSNRYEDNNDARFSSVGVRYSWEIGINRRWSVMPSLGIGQNTYEYKDTLTGDNTTERELDLNYGIGIRHFMIDRGTSISAGLNSYDRSSHNLAAYVRFNYHF
jgi:hypothetical protein